MPLCIPQAMARVMRDSPLTGIPAKNPLLGLSFLTPAP